MNPYFFTSDRYFYLMAKETYYLPFEWIVNSSWLNQMLEKRSDEKVLWLFLELTQKYIHPINTEKEDRKIIIALGKSSKIKGLDYLFEALKIIKKRSNSDLKLVLYGNEPFLVKRSPIPTEYVINPSDKELAKLYSKADVAVIPSLYESSPLPPLEAMACGTPVVTTRYGTEDYCFNEVNSLVVMPGDPKSLAEAILRVLTDEDLAEKLKINGLKTAKEYTWEKTVEKVEKVLLKKLKKGDN